MEQPYWAGIHDSLADGIQFVENHVGLTESIEGSPQRPAKKKAKFSRGRGLDLQRKRMDFTIFKNQIDQI